MPRDVNGRLGLSRLDHLESSPVHPEILVNPLNAFWTLYVPSSLDTPGKSLHLLGNTPDGSEKAARVLACLLVGRNERQHRSLVGLPGLETELQ